MSMLGKSKRDTINIDSDDDRENTIGTPPTILSNIKKNQSFSSFMTPKRKVDVDEYCKENLLPEKAKQSKKRVVRPVTLGENPKGHFKDNEKPNAAQVIKLLADFPNEYFKQEPPGRLFCDCCRNELSWKKSTVAKHVVAKCHEEAKKKRDATNVRDQSMHEYLAAAKREGIRRTGDTLSAQNSVWRLKLCRSAMIGGIKFTQLDDPLSGFGDILRIATGPFNVQDLRDKIPDIKKMEIDEIKSELQFSKAPIGIIFDGSTKVAEVLALIIRWFDQSTGIIEQRLISASMWSRAFTGDNLARVLIEKLSVEFSIPLNRIHVACRDGCSVNTAAVNVMRPVFNNMYDLHCSAHAANNAGLLFACPVAKKFVSSWSEMMSSSPLARQLFSASVEHKTQRKSKIRWGTEQMVAKQIFENPQAVIALLNSPLEFAPALKTSLRNMMTYEIAGEASQILFMEMALIGVVGQYVCDFIYQYEGDTFIAHKMFTAKELLIAQLRTVVDDHICPTLTVAAAVYPHPEAAAAAVIVTCEKARPVLEKMLSYFEETRFGRLRDTYLMFKAFTILNPCKFRQMGVAGGAALVDILMYYGPIQQAAHNIRNRLIEELPTYLVHAADAGDDVDVLLWWFEHKHHLPTWYNVVIPEAVIFQPTSCAAERVFSMFSWMFTDNQAAALEDFKEYSLILRYNANARKHLGGV